MFISTKPYLTATIQEMDNLPACHPASVHIDVANTYYAITKMLRPLLVVEIGCFIGFSTQHFALALSDLGFGKIISIDAFDWDIDAGRGPQNRHEVAEYYREKSGLDNITFIKGLSREVYWDIYEEINNKIDLLYIDGDHSVKGVFEDFNLYYNDVRKGGYILLHDIYPTMCSVDGPRSLVDRLIECEYIPKYIDLIEMNTPDGFGIALLRKTSSSRVSILPNGMSQSDVDCETKRNTIHHIRDSIYYRASEEYQVIFQILDSVTHRPISNAKLTCPQRCNESMTTAEDGLIHMPHYLPNRYLLNFEADGYRDLQNQIFDISSDKGHHHFIIQMQPHTLIVS